MIQQSDHFIKTQGITWTNDAWMVSSCVAHTEISFQQIVALVQVEFPVWIQDYTTYMM